MVKSITTACCHSKISISDERYEVCPVCRNKYYDKPRDEFILFSAQDKFLSNNRDIKILWNEAYPTIKKYAQIILCKKLNTSNCRYTKDDLEDLSSDISMKLMCKFSDICDYKVDVSFGEVIKNLIVSEIYSDKRKFQDSIININNKDSEDDENKSQSYGDYIAYTNYNDDEELFRTNISDKISKIGNSIMDICSSNKMNSILSLTALLHFIRKDKDTLDELYVVFGDDFSEEYNAKLDIIRDGFS